MIGKYTNGTVHPLYLICLRDGTTYEVWLCVEALLETRDHDQLIVKQYNKN